MQNYFVPELRGRANHSASGGRSSHCASGARPSSTPATRRTGIRSEYVQLRSTAVFIHSLKAVYVAARTAVRMAMRAQRQRTGSAARVRTRAAASALTPISASPTVQCATANAIREAGARPTLRKKSGTADLNLAVPVWGCPAAAYGPGDSHLDHTDEESLAGDDLRRSVGVLRRAFEALGIQ